MTALHSPRWHRVAHLMPALSQRARLRRQRLRGETWYVLADPLGGRSVRLNAAAYAVAGRLDGRLTVQQLWDALMASNAEPATQDEVIDLLAQLREASLIDIDRTADFDVLLPHLDEVARPRGRDSLLAWRVPLADPSRLLERLRPLQALLFSRAALGCWLLAVCALVVLALQHAPQLAAHGRLWMATPRFALIAVLLYLPMKLLHELAHGLAVRRWGGQVREAGVTLMMLMPVPYVDASAASGFARRRERIAVGAAGIMAELAVAAAALPLWLWLGDGLTRDIAFVAFVIAGASTLLFNANPLQRLDGYYVLTDALDLPNLAPRSRAWWQDLMVRRLLRVPRVEPMALARGETPWLAAYAPLAWLYSILVGLLALAWLGQLSTLLGLTFGALLSWQLLVQPARGLLGPLRRVAARQQASGRRWRRLANGALALLALAVLVPVPQRALVQGVVWPPDAAQLRADEDGFVESVQAGPGQSVEPGDAVLSLTNPALLALVERQASRVAGLETSLYQAIPEQSALPGDARAGDARAELTAAQAELQRLNERVAALTIRAHAAGRVAFTQAADLQGRYLRRGALVGQVLTGVPPTVRVALPEAEAGELQRRLRGVSVRLAASSGVAREATLLRDSVGAVMQLPSAALSARHGGDVPTDPRDTDDLKPTEPVVLIDVRLGTGAGDPDERIGERAWVRLDSGLSPLALQWAQTIRRQVLRRFNPQV